MRLAPLSAVVLTACYSDVTQSEIDDLVARVDALEAENAALRAMLPSDLAEGDVVATRSELAGYVTSDALGDYALAADLAAEADARNTADAALATGLAEEAAERVAGDEENHSDLLAVSNAAAAELDRVDAELVALATSVTDEATERADADSALDARLATVEGDYASASALAMLDTRVADIEADYLAEADLGGVVQIINTDDTWTVDQYGTGEYADLESAVAALDGYHIAAGATLTIALDPGSYYLSEAITIQHPDGGRVEIVGNAAAPNDVNLYFTGSGGFVVEGTDLGYLGGLTVIGDGTSDKPGLTVTNGTVEIGPMIIDDFDAEGILVDAHGTLLGDSGYSSTPGWLTVRDVGGAGIQVRGGSAAYLEAFEVDGAGWIGAFVRESSYLDGDYSSVHDCGDVGYDVERESMADLEHSTSSNNGSYGYYTASSLNAYMATASDNASYGFLSSAGGVLLASTATSDSNGDDVELRAEYGAYLYADGIDITPGGEGTVQSLDGSYVRMWGATVNGDGGFYNRGNAFIYARDVSISGSTSYQSDQDDVTDFMYGIGD